MPLTADGNGLDILGTEDCSRASSTGVSPIMRDGRIPYNVLAGRSDHRELKSSTQLSAKCRLRLGCRAAPELASRSQLDCVIVDNQDARLGGLAGYYDRISTNLLAGNCEGALWAQMRIHVVRNGVMDKLGYSSKLNAEWDFVSMLHREGRTAAEGFLQAHADQIGVKSTVDLDLLLEEV